MTISPSSTSAGKGDSAGRTAAPRPGGSTVRQRKPTASKTTRSAPVSAGGGQAGMWRFYTEDSPGLKV